MSVREQPPCHNCTDDRHCGCHGTCGKYLKWRKELDEENAKIYAARTKEKAADEVLIKSAIKTAKRNRKR